MSDSELPDDLAALEQALSARRGPDGGAELRSRVLRAMGGEARRRDLPWRPLRKGGRYLAAAAAVLLWINLSMSMVANTEWRAPVAADYDADRLAARIRALAPELSQRESRRQALA